MELKQCALTYTYKDLEPQLCEKNVQIHYETHHKLYATTYEKMVDGSAELQNLPKDLEQHLVFLAQKKREAQQGVEEARNSPAHFQHFQAAQLYNHNLFFTNLCPASKNEVFKQGLPDVMKQIAKDITGREPASYEDFLEALNEKCLAISKEICGSGWIWGCQDTKTGEYVLRTTMDGNNLINTQFEVIFTIDLWEHTWYLTYQNKKGSYLQNVLQILDWQQVTEQATQLSANWI